LEPAYYTVNIGGTPEALPIIPTETGAIALLMVIDRGVHFGERIGRLLAERLAPFRPEIVMGTATLGIPVAIEVTRALALDRYIIAQKSRKIHLASALAAPVQSTTTEGSQVLLLDQAYLPWMAGRRIVVVDDVAASGNSLKATLNLARQAQAQVKAIGVILTEGYEWVETLGEDARHVHALGHIPRFTRHGHVAVPIPESPPAGFPIFSDSPPPMSHP